MPAEAPLSFMQVALKKLDEDPIRLDEIANVLLTVHQCERSTFRYMAHVMQAVQQCLRMKQAIAEMDYTTAYLIFDFKQKFLAKGFREGGDSYYGKKVMLWWGAGVFTKPYTTEEEVRSGESNEELHVMIDFSDEKVRLLQQVGVVNEGNDGGVQDVEIDENMEGDGCEKEGEGDGCEDGDGDGCAEEREADHDGYAEEGEGDHDGCEEEGEGDHDGVRRERLIMMGVKREREVGVKRRGVGVMRERRMGVKRKERVMGVKRERGMKMKRGIGIMIMRECKTGLVGVKR